jgi:hypothetical protein
MIQMHLAIAERDKQLYELMSSGENCEWLCHEADVISKFLNEKAENETMDLIRCMWKSYIDRTVDYINKNTDK